MDAPGRFDLVSIMHDHTWCNGYGIIGTTSVSGTVPLNIYNVQVTNIKTTSATISWNTNNPSGSSVTSQVSYGIDTSYGSSVSDSSTGLHSVNLSTLSPGTKYYYQIQSTSH